MPASTPDVIIEPFGASAGGSYINLPIPVPSTGTNAASFHDGFPAVTMTPEGSGGEPMLGPDMNGILYMITSYLSALTGGQFWPYNASWESNNGGYAVGAVLSMAAGNGFWINTVANNANNPDTTAAASSGWVPLACYGTTSISGLTTGTVTLTAPQAACSDIVLTGSLTGNVSIVLPPWNKRWRIINNTTGGTATSITAIASGGSNTVVLLQFGTTGYTDVYCDNGVDVFLAGYQAVGFFTGTLTGCTTSPTQSIHYNVNGTTCTLSLGGGLTGTSNSSSMTMTGLPGFLCPYPLVSEAAQPANLNIGGNWTLGVAQISVLTIYFYVSAVSGSLVQYSAVGFPTSGTKGIQAWQMTYPMI